MPPPPDSCTLPDRAMIRALLVDDHPMIREAIRLILRRQEEVFIIDEADDGETALALAARQLPDIVILDLCLPGLPGAETARELLVRHSGIRILVFSADINPQLIEKMLVMGVRGYICKTGGSAELLKGVRTVLAGNTFLCSCSAEQLCKGLQSPEHGKVLAFANALTPREREIALLLAEGLTASEIARHLFIAQSTVDVHRRNLMRKLGLHSKVELVLYAIREGMIRA